MLKKLMLLLCLSAFVAVVTVGGCGKKEEPKEPPKTGDETEKEKAPE